MKTNQERDLLKGGVDSRPGLLFLFEVRWVPNQFCAFKTLRAAKASAKKWNGKIFKLTYSTDHVGPISETELLPRHRQIKRN